MLPIKNRDDAEGRRRVVLHMNIAGIKVGVLQSGIPGRRINGSKYTTFDRGNETVEHIDMLSRGVRGFELIDTRSRPGVGLNPDLFALCVRR